MDAPTSAADATTLGQRLGTEVLEPLKRSFVGKVEIIDLIGIALVARENLFLLGPPGTATSALIYELGRRIQGRTFEYLLTRFTEPNELFGPFAIRRLREGDLVTNTEGMLPEDDALGALFDRFLIRAVCSNIPDDRLVDMLHAGWRLDRNSRN